MSIIDACGILTIKHLLAIITNMAQKQNEHHGYMQNSDNQALTSFDHKHGTEAEWAPCMHVGFWQSSTHRLWWQTWYRSTISTMDACEILTIKHSLALITNMAQKQNEHHEWCKMLTIKHLHPLITNITQSRMSTMDACRILTIKHSHTVITNMAQKQNEHHRHMHNSDNQALTCFDHKHDIEAEWAPCMHMGFWQSNTHLLWSQTWHRSRMSTMHACAILTIKHSLALITNIAQK